MVVWIFYAYLTYQAFPGFSKLVLWAMDPFSSDAPLKLLMPSLSFLSFVWLTLAIYYVFFVWSVYNELRYGRKKRRRASQPVTRQELARIHRIEASDVKAYQSAKNLVIHHDPRGLLLDVEMD